MEQQNKGTTLWGNDGTREWYFLSPIQKPGLFIYVCLPAIAIFFYVQKCNATVIIRVCSQIFNSWYLMFKPMSSGSSCVYKCMHTHMCIRMYVYMSYVSGASCAAMITNATHAIHLLNRGGRRCRWPTSGLALPLLGFGTLPTGPLDKESPSPGVVPNNTPIPSFPILHRLATMYLGG